MGKTHTDYEIFEQSSPHNRRLLREEELIVEVAEALSKVMEEESMTKTELARRLGKTKGFISQLLGGGRNLTLRTIADVADTLGCHVQVTLSRRRERERFEGEGFPQTNVTIPVRLVHSGWHLSSHWRQSVSPVSSAVGLEGIAA